MKKSPELRQKLNEVSKNDRELGDRLEDYFGNTGYVLVHKEDILKSGKITKEEMDALELEYKKMVEVVLLLPIQDTLLKLDDNKPSKKGTNSNIESLKRAFLN